MVYKDYKGDNTSGYYSLELNDENQLKPIPFLHE